MRKINHFYAFSLMCFSIFNVLSGQVKANVLEEKAEKLRADLNIEKLVKDTFYESLLKDLATEVNRFDQIHKVVLELPEQDDDSDTIVTDSDEFEEELLKLQIKIFKLAIEVQDTINDINNALAERINDAVEKIKKQPSKYVTRDDIRALVQPIYFQVFSLDIEGLHHLNDNLEAAINEYNDVAKKYHRDEL